MSAIQAVLMGFSGVAAAVYEQVYTTPGTYSWVCPAGVTSVCVVCVGSGGSRVPGYDRPANGGALAWKNNISVIPGNSYNLVVGGAGTISIGSSAQSSHFAAVVIADGGIHGGSNTRASFTGDGGGQGGIGIYVSTAGGGGGAGGYSGNGGNGGGPYTAPADWSYAGVGGGGGGGACGGAYPFGGGRGGGVGIFGQGANGIALPRNLTGHGQDGINGSTDPQSASAEYGGGGSFQTYAGGTGAVRIIWGAGRAFPSTNVGAGFVPSGGGGGGGNTYATWNPLDKSSSITLSNGNLTVMPDSVGWKGVRSTISKSSGKWYWEYTMGIVVSNIMVGISNSSRSINSYADSALSGRELYNNGTIYGGGVGYAAPFSNGTNIGVALDADNNTITWYYYGVANSTVSTVISSPYFASCSPYDCGLTANFGATPFVYPVPSGFNAGLYT